MVPGLSIDPRSGVPVYRQIADGIRASALAGRLPAGHKLPPTRVLAHRLGVNRNTVVAAYELLGQEGIVLAQTGSGTYVAAVLAAPPPREGDAWFTAFSRAVQGPAVGSLLSAYRAAISAEGISFAGSYPARDLMPVDAFRDAVSTALAENGPEILSYGPTAGHPALREAIAERMRLKGSDASAAGILVTNGSQQALDLVFRVLLDPGDPVAIEDPTYTGALSALGSLGARLVGIPLDEEGIRPDLLALALERHRPRVLYVQPTFQNPTTRVMGEARRREVLALAARHRCIVVEDDWAGDLRLEGDDLPTLHTLDEGRHVIYVSTFSKKLLPGLRVGWVTAPEPVHERLVTLKQIEDCGTSPMVQAALHAFLARGGLEAHLARVRPAYRERRDRMLRALDRHFPAAVSWSRPEGGLFVWSTLPDGIDSKELLARSQARGVLFNGGELFHIDGEGGRSMRLSFAAASPEQIDAGVKILGDLVREHGAGAGRRGPGRAAEAVPIL